jgi:hypothetical protein
MKFIIDYHQAGNQESTGSSLFLKIGGFNLCASTGARFYFRQEQRKPCTQ